MKMKNSKHPQPALILLNKPPGITSFKALSSVKRVLSTTKVGHCGTLDKFASGLLIVLVGKATKMVPLFTGQDKTYHGTLHFGSQTDTLDPEGRVEKTCPLPDQQEARDAALSFIGEYAQVPPVFSAIHIKGKRAYQRQLQGEEVTMPARQVTIRDLKIVNQGSDFLEFQVTCSKGTYIRSLARDIAQRCGSCATLTRLHRQSIGSYSVDAAAGPEDFAESPGYLTGLSFINAIPGAGYMEISPEEQGLVQQGILAETLLTRVARSSHQGSILFLIDSREHIIASLDASGSQITFNWVQPTDPADSPAY